MSPNPRLRESGRTSLCRKFAMNHVPRLMNEKLEFMQGCENVARVKILKSDPGKYVLVRIIANVQLNATFFGPPGRIA